ncbi:hypothetical protein DYI37_04015 [Fulvimarina endophytica]|uniref:Uncharacterized protein n=2 Tax=Fulvimarina endophytica TaxID=2293836 RepID=A0A371X729_9HYPH|nr:hypothetical protein DYI37_04015 [Fulvimarina endophytica]
MDRALLLQAQRRLTASFAPEDDDGRVLDRTERGAIAIFGEVTGTRSFDLARRKWDAVARPLTKERHRREAAACLRAAG